MKKDDYIWCRQQKGFLKSDLTATFDICEAEPYSEAEARMLFDSPNYMVHKWEDIQPSMDFTLKIEKNRFAVYSLSETSQNKIYEPLEVSITLGERERKVAFRLPKDAVRHEDYTGWMWRFDTPDRGSLTSWHPGKTPLKCQEEARKFAIAEMCSTGHHYTDLYEATKRPLYSNKLERRIENTHSNPLP
ncbi:hypothetical protein ACI2KR_08150 [Pseudomonas luteola]